MALTAFALTLLSLPPHARAESQEAAARPLTARPEPEALAPQTAAYRFNGRALYAGAGAGYVADIQAPSFNATWNLTLPISAWTLFEVGGSLAHLGVVNHQGEDEQTNGLGINLGLRIAPFTAGLVRPYLATRVAHVHFSPDPWGEHEENSDGTYDHSSTHRWGAALAAGLDAPLVPSAPRWRVGLDIEAMALSGPTANLLLHAALMLGVGL